MILSSVDFPEPLRPMMPNASPRSTANETSRTAVDAGLRRQLQIALEQRALERGELRPASPQAVGLGDVGEGDGVVGHWL